MKKTLNVVTVEQLKNPFIYFIIWHNMRHLRFHRRDVPNELSLLQLDFALKDVTVLLDGQPFEILEIDGIIKDPDFRWYSDYIQKSPIGLFPLTRCRRDDIVQWFHLYLQWHQDKTSDLFKNYLKV